VPDPLDVRSGELAAPGRGPDRDLRPMESSARGSAPGSVRGRSRGARARPRRRHRALLAALLAVVLAGAGGTALVSGLQAQTAPPPPPSGRAAGAIPAPDLHPQHGSPATRDAATRSYPPVTRRTPSSAPSNLRTSRVHALAASPPTAIDVPAIGVHGSLIHLDLNSDKTVQVPTDYRQAGWYDRSPMPGEVGPAIILGHIDSYQGPGVFFRLADLRPGNTIVVHRAAGAPATFTVEAIRRYPKDHFPSAKVYGPVGYAGLRLISCGGAFDSAARSYADNIVVYARLA